MVTVFTPTYNRAQFLPRLYQSLLNQTDKNFIWLIVDDGSDDGTDELISTYQNKGLIQIEYYKQNNSGKHIAHNLGAEKCHTEWFVCVDSDDWLEENAIESFYSDLRLVSEDNKNNYIGIIYPKTRFGIGMPKYWFPPAQKEVCVSDMLIFLNNKVETAIFFRTDALKAAYFPQFEKERYLAEEILLSQLSKLGVFYPIYKSVYLYEYLEDGLTSKCSRLWLSNPIGTLTFLRGRYVQLVHSKHKLKHKILPIIKCIMHINALCFATHKNIITNTPNLAISFFLLVPAKLFSIYKYHGCLKE